MSVERASRQHDASLDNWTLCPLSPSAVKRPKMIGYTTGGSWREGRVELKFDNNTVTEQDKRQAELTILEGFQRLSQTIQGEGLYSRSYMQLTPCIDASDNSPLSSSLSTFECLGDSEEASCARIGSILPIRNGYSVYGRIDNVQVLVQDAAEFGTVLDQLIDAKVAMLRQATVSLGILARERDYELHKLEVQYQQRLDSFEKYHRDVLVGHICEQHSPAELTKVLAEWESQRQDICARWRYENKEAIMDIEHVYHCNRTSLLLACRV